MPYLAGVLTGVLLTILVVFLVDNLAVANAPAGSEPQKTLTGMWRLRSCAPPLLL